MFSHVGNWLFKYFVKHKCPKRAFSILSNAIIFLPYTKDKLSMFCFRAFDQRTVPLVIVMDIFHHFLTFLRLNDSLINQENTLQMDSNY